MSTNPTTGELYKAKAITSDKIDAAVDAVLAQPGVGPYPIGGDYLLDLSTDIEAHEPSAAALTDPDRPEKFRRIMARTAILLARPEKV
jgi:hypothetical protein